MATKTRPESTEPKKPRVPASPDIQALARIDRILSNLPDEVAYRTLQFLTAKYMKIEEAATPTPREPVA